MTAPRIFLGLGDTCGYYSRLEMGLREIGVVHVTLVDAFPSRPYGRCSRPGPVGRLVEWLGRRRIAAPRRSARRLLWQCLQGAVLVALLLTSLVEHDVYVFAGGESFLRLYDLPLLKLFRKKVIVVFHGSEVRPPYINGAVVGTEGDFDAASCARAAAAMKRRLRWIERFADISINHPFTSQFHERSVVSWLAVGIPTSCPQTPDERTRQPAADGTLRILHAPSRPGPKGSPQIIAAIERLRARGWKIDFTLLTGRPPAEVMTALADCDFVIDEIYSDTFMASFATEAAAFGKAAIVGLHQPERLKELTIGGMVPPVVACHPDELEATIELVLSDEKYRRRVGREAEAFVRNQWSTASVAARFLRLMTDGTPEAWTFQPHHVHYLNGWGLTERRCRHVLREFIKQCGMDALQLSDKPSLESAIRSWASAAPPHAAAPAAESVGSHSAATPVT